jgi:NTE family protein
VLPGGGARCAYQVGALKALAQLLPGDGPIPFRVISGTSGGAIVGSVVAAHAMHFRRGVVALERFWRNFRIGQVFRADDASMLRAGLHWLLALASGGWLARSPHALLDNAPLRRTLARHVNFAHIARALEHGHLDALSVSVSPYRRGHSMSFYAASPGHARAGGDFPDGVAAEIGVDHLMASAAVPFLFEPVCMQGEWYGDGSMRQTSPLSPALHLGADRLLVIGVRPAVPSPASPGEAAEPSFGQIFGFMLDTLFMDGVQADLERLRRDNELISAAAAAGAKLPGARRVEALHLVPGEDFGEIAARHAADMPRAVRALLRMTGAENHGGRMLLSYLLFEGAYARELIALGYRDAMRRRDELQAFACSEEWRETTPG